MENILAKVIEERDSKLSKIWNEYDGVAEEYNKKIADILPYKDKYIRITIEGDYTRYCKVTGITINKEKLTIWGLWYTGEVSEYAYDNFLKFEYGTHIYNIRDIENLVNSIEIITKEEYFEFYKKLSNEIITDLEQM